MRFYLNDYNNKKTMTIENSIDLAFIWNFMYKNTRLNYKEKEKNVWWIDFLFYFIFLSQPYC